MEGSIAKKRKLNRTKPESWNDVKFTDSNTNGSKEIFEAVRMGSKDVLKKLLATNGLDVTSKLAQSYNEEGETPLLVAIKCKHLNVVKFLVEDLKVNIGQIGRFFWKMMDYSEVLPLFASIISDQLSIMQFLFAEEMKYKSTISLDSIMSSSIPRPQKIDQLELIGATFILFKNVSSISQEDDGINDPDEQQGRMCWKEAMTLRLCPADGEPQIPKIPFQLSDRGRKAFGDLVEPMTLEQVVQSLKSPSLIGEAFLVAIRYLSRAGLFPNLFIPDRFYTHFLREYYTCSDIGYVFKHAMYLLELLEPCKWEDDFLGSTSSILHHYNNDFNNLNSALDTIASVIKKMGWSLDSKFGSGMLECIPMPTDFDNCMFIFRFCCNHIRRVIAQFCHDGQLTIIARRFITDTMEEITILLIEISGCILILMSQLTAEEIQQLQQSITEFIHLCDQTGTCRSKFFNYFCVLMASDGDHFENVGVIIIQHFIDSGLLDPNAVDDEGDTVLHHLISRLQFHCDTGIEKFSFTALVQMLDNGGQIDKVNNDGQTVRGILAHWKSELIAKDILIILMVLTR
ncbi:uncharacterized protein LOC124208129 isoform X1 [Daphnia pulex]|uniref:uncharacterized protein LOC124208129 isoform X1 n=1 Tax=Daphnia pulex TaxID=6669 RepID=UPI001EDD3990|nr:uncharacterized protein LOC124208129 isoform X1 [Daphnia pulex]